MPEKTISLRNHIPEADLPKIAEQIIETHKDRKRRRKDTEKHWSEIDRQLRMEPEKSHKTDKSGKAIPGSEWLPEIELPLQAQTLEVLVADVMRFIFPRGRDWFRASVAMSDEYLNRFKAAQTPIFREKGPDEGGVDQDDVNRIAQAVPSHFHRQYPFRQYIGQANAEALGYGFGVGRMRRVNKHILQHTAKGKNMKIPMFIPRSAKNVYLDDSKEAVMHEGEIIGPNIIQTFDRKLSDLQAAAKNDKSYNKEQIKRLVPGKDDCVTLVELEGDLVYSMSDKTVVVKDIVLTAAKAENDNKATVGLVREQPGEGFSTYIIFDYHKESAMSAYATAPLMKGLPVQRMASQIMNMLIASGQLKVQPPIGYGRDEPHFASTGGPIVQPNAQWETNDDVNVVDVGGDPSVFFSIYAGLNSLYNDVTGQNPARVGAQTLSHTTAFAKDVEVNQGAARTIDYTDDVLLDPMTRMLEIEYRMGVKDWNKQVVYIEAWDEFVELSKAHLPDTVLFKALGAGAPAEDNAKVQSQQAAIQAAMQVDAAAMQLGFRQQPRIDYDAVIDRLLEAGGIQDVSEVVNETVESAGLAQGQQLPGILSSELQ